jgi:uncharacterized protein (TIGR02145 family)
MKRFAMLIIIISILFKIEAQERRLALVIGNGNYINGGLLSNPENDADSVCKKLLHLGFNVIIHKNLDKIDLKKAIDEFGDSLNKFDVGLFFYAGHGIQAHGINFLIPTDAYLKTENDVEYNCVEVGRVLTKMEDAGTKMNIIILDACRDNPFERQWSRSTGGLGLAYMSSPVGTLIAYSTAPGKTASDGYTFNSPYTTALLRYIDQPNITILQMFQFVRKEVREYSNNLQIPWETTSLEGNFYFVNINFNSNNYDFNNISDTKLKIDNSEIALDFFIDQRDGKRYKTVKIGNQLWMAENINYEIPNSDSWCYNDQKFNCQEYGRLYPFYSAIESCPPGWHLPSDDEWKTMEIYLGMSIEEANKSGAFYWSRGEPLGEKLRVNDTSGFNLLLGGFCNYDKNMSRSSSGEEYNKSFQFLNRAAYFWTSTKTPENKVYQRWIYKAKDGILRSDLWPLTQGLSVRCIKNQ